MSWREKLGLPEISDRSDESTPSITSVTSFPYEPGIDSSGEHLQSGLPDVASGPERSVAWAEWKAASLNQLFRDLGVTGQEGHITAATVRHGFSTVDCAATVEPPMSRAEATE
jgi:hypothetical protein